MKKLALVASLIVAASFTGAAYANGGHGRGHGGYHAYRGTPPGWHHGRKVGWHGRGCPPGLWKQGRC